ncbi:NADH-quinone oxidoreductase subunit K [Vulcanisaeta souniana]|uniref:F420H(2):quinone oxidoreductase n=1 Tax=Vulcanisaeta souniana JCM 11219 TaxID=1293586 RepID=A0A830EAQ3_9CREN|nr:NADH-quinone oxidoreductase subunit K [Vulcanisaeta souniana]BDR93083.1 F420H(2):quinone oxidoreductase [Vulcanisaeta souniana JCM 11219]GGI87235.1 F420H(2):quinone oxidoreductase [Vulcanisaeta souniana JCM 11219]
MEVNSAIIYGFASIILMIGYYSALRANDLIRVLISLELMFNAIFLALIPLFAVNPVVAFGILIVTILASSTEFMTLIIAIMSMDRIRKSVRVEEVKAGGEQYVEPKSNT